MHADYGEVEDNRQVLHQLQTALRSGSVLNEAAKVVKSVTHGVVDEGPGADAWDAWTTLCCGSVYCGYNYNISVVRALEAINEGAYTAVSSGLHELLRPLLSSDPFACEVRRRLATSNAGSSDWDDTDGVLKYQGRMYLPAVIRSDLLARNHDDPLAGHFGVEDTRAT